MACLEKVSFQFLSLRQPQATALLGAGLNLPIMKILPLNFTPMPALLRGPLSALRHFHSNR